MLCDRFASLRFLKQNIIRYQEKSISQTHNLIKKGIKFIWQDLFSIRPGWLTLIIFNTRFCPRLPACGCCLLFPDFNLRLCKWAYRHVLLHGRLRGRTYQRLQRPLQKAKAASLLTTLPGSVARKTGCIKRHPAHATPHLKMPDKPSDPKTAGRSLTTGS